MNIFVFIMKALASCLFFAGIMFFSSCSTGRKCDSKTSCFQDQNNTLVFDWPTIRFDDEADRSFFDKGWRIFLRSNGETGYYPLEVFELFVQREEVEKKIDTIEALNEIDIFRIEDEKQVLRYLNIFFKDNGLAFYFSAPWVIGIKDGDVKILRVEDGFIIERDVFVLEHKRLRTWGDATLYSVREKLSFDGKYKLLESTIRSKHEYRLSGDVLLLHMEVRSRGAYRSEIIL